MFSFSSAESPMKFKKKNKIIRKNAHNIVIMGSSTLSWREVHTSKNEKWKIFSLGKYAVPRNLN
jgi:hypothetical protein